MGALVWNVWANNLAINAALTSILGSTFAFFIRRYFFDMINNAGIIAGQGIVPGSSAALPVFLIVKYPIVQSVNVLNALILLAAELPLPFLAGTFIHRSLFLRMIILLWCGFSSALVYQTFIASIFYGIAFFAYFKAFCNGERIGEDLENHSSKTPV